MFGFFTSKCPQCGKPVDKKAKFCRHCGHGNERSWRQCTACGVHVSASSSYCWSCSANLSLQPRDQIVQDRWRRQPGVFAIRVPLESPKERLRHGIQMDEGVIGVLMRNGVIEEKLHPGYNEMTSFIGRLFGSGKPSGTLEALIAARAPVDVPMDFSFNGQIRSRDGAELACAVLLSLQVDDLRTFAVQMMPYGVEMIRDEELARPIESRVRETLARYTGQRSIEALATDHDLRKSLEAELGTELPQLLQPFGLRLLSVKDVRIGGETLDRHRQMLAEIAEEERRRKAELALKTFQAQITKSEFSSEAEVKEHLANLSHQYNLNQLERQKFETIAQIEIDTIKHRAKLEREREEDEQANKTLEQVRKGQMETLQRMAEIKVNTAKGLSGLDPNAIIAVSAPEQGRLVVDALRALNPEPKVWVQPATHSGVNYTPSSGHSFASLANSLIPAVGIVVVTLPGGSLKACGTAWIPHGRNLVVTNAHVAEAVLEAHEQAKLTSNILFPGGTVSISNVQLHPNYKRHSTLELVPAYDVAVMEVTGSLTHPGLPLAGKAKALALRSMQAVAYMGFPTENLAMGGVNLEKPRAMGKPGHITALTDWHLRAVDPADTRLIQHDIGVVGGASGSPMLDESGEIIGIICAGNMELMLDPQTQTLKRSPSAAMVNFAQRIDVLTDWTGW
jgi:S1-C subfamily serine protease